MTVYHKTGGRTVELFVPFDHGGSNIEAIVFGPIRLDHTLRWQAGNYSSVLALMAEVSGMEEPVLRMITYPDADRVLSIFIEMLPPEIRSTVGNPPQQQEPAPSEFPEEQPAPTADPTGLGMDLNG